MVQESTKSILLAVQGLSSKFKTYIGGMKYRLTSLSKQINIKDRQIYDRFPWKLTHFNN